MGIFKILRSVYRGLELSIYSTSFLVQGESSLILSLLSVSSGICLWTVYWFCVCGQYVGFLLITIGLEHFS